MYGEGEGDRHTMTVTLVNTLSVFLSWVGVATVTRKVRRAYIMLCALETWNVCVTWWTSHVTSMFRT